MFSQVTRGIKRTFGVEMNDVTTQRQSILDISMCKLQTSPVKKVEPSLRRSVLIFNTLKHIEQELHQEGVRVYPTSKTSLIPSIQSDDSSPELEAVPTLLNHMDRLPSKTPVEKSDNVYISVPRTMGCDNNDLLKAVGLHCSTPTAHLMDTGDASAAHSNAQYQNLTQHSAQNLSREYEDFLNANPSTNSSTPSFEEMLTDLDLTMYDMDLFTLNSSSKLTPLSGEDLDMFAPLATPINCKNDFLFDDLDSLMQQVFVTSS